MISSNLSRSLGLAAALAISVAPALADTAIAVQVNQAKIVKLSRPADTIVVGNPLIADASVQDSTTLVLTGKGFGTTNLVVLDGDGVPIVDEQVSVSRDTSSTVRIYRRAQVQTLHCTPVCENAYKSASEKESDKEMAESQ
jgi:Flp pilus assembly secretin CpaC